MHKERRRVFKELLRQVGESVCAAVDELDGLDADEERGEEPAEEDSCFCRAHNPCKPGTCSDAECGKADRSPVTGRPKDSPHLDGVDPVDLLPDWILNGAARCGIRIVDETGKQLLNYRGILKAMVDQCTSQAEKPCAPGTCSIPECGKADRTPEEQAAFEAAIPGYLARCGVEEEIGTYPTEAMIRLARRIVDSVEEMEIPCDLCGRWANGLTLVGLPLCLVHRGGDNAIELRAQRWAAMPLPEDAANRAQAGRVANPSGVLQPGPIVDGGRVVGEVVALGDVKPGKKSRQRRSIGELDGAVRDLLKEFAVVVNMTTIREAKHRPGRQLEIRIEAETVDVYRFANGSEIHHAPAAGSLTASGGIQVQDAQPSTCTLCHLRAADAGQGEWLVNIVPSGPAWVVACWTCIDLAATEGRLIQRRDSPAAPARTIRCGACTFPRTIKRVDFDAHGTPGFWCGPCLDGGKVRRNLPPPGFEVDIPTSGVPAQEEKPPKIEIPPEPRVTVEVGGEDLPRAIIGQCRLCKRSKVGCRWGEVCDDCKPHMDLTGEDAVKTIPAAAFFEKDAAREALEASVSDSAEWRAAAQRTHAAIAEGLGIARETIEAADPLMAKPLPDDVYYPPEAVEDDGE